MVDSGLVRGRATEHLGLPRVEMGVKVNDGDRAVRAVNRAQDGEDDRMIAAERDNAGMVLSVGRDGHEGLARQRVVAERRERLAVEELLVSVLDLLNGELVIVRRNRDVATVDDLQATQERVDLQRHVVSTVEGEAARTSTDARRSEPSTRAIRGTGILSIIVSSYLIVVYGCMFNSRKERR